MKKEQIIKLMLFLIIPFLAISCDSDGLMEYEETALMQGDAQQGLLSDEASDNTCMVNLNLFTKPYFDYQYNTDDHVDECFVYIDNQEDLTGRLSLRGDENVKSNIPISFGKHQIKLDIQIDGGKSYTYPFERCNALVTLKTKGSSIVLFNDVVSQKKGGSITNTSFEVKFDVDFPYAESNDYALDITLGFYDETYDDGSSGPYVNGNVSVYTYYQWTDITSAQTVYCDFILGVRYNSTQKEYWYSKDFEQNLFVDKNGMLINNVNWLDKTVRLPDGDDIGYKLFLLTEIWAKLYSSIGVMSGETEVSWYSVYYRNKENDGEYSGWYPADELDTSLAWVDATIDFYSNLEIVCFKTKEIQDAYASQWGIVPYN